MALSNDLISQFAKVVNSVSEDKREKTVYGTVKTDGNKKVVELDGSNYGIPLSSTTDVSDGDRVTVMIKDHTAVVTGNLSTPSINKETTVDNGDRTSTKISELGIVIADKVNTKELQAETARIDTLYADVLQVENVEVDGELVAKSAKIENLEADNAKFNKVTTDVLSAEFVTVDGELVAKSAVIDDLKAGNAEFRNLKADYADFKILTATKAEIEELDVKKADITWANIDFANIDTAKIEQLYASSGLIEDVIIDNGTITGNLVGVTIKGDLIEGGTVVADKLVIKGDDGIYYKLNTDGGDYSYTPDTVNTYVKTEETLESIPDLVTEIEDAVTTTGEQVYKYTDRNSDTQLYCVVDSVYYKVIVQNEYNSIHGSNIIANSITATQINVSDLVAFGATIGGFQITNDSINSFGKVTHDSGANGIYMDNSGQFSLGDDNNYIHYYKDVDEQGNEKYRLAIAAENIQFKLNNGATMDLSEVGKLGERVKVNNILNPETHNTEPCLELEEDDTKNKLTITNTRLIFSDDDEILSSYSSNQTNIGGFVWKKRANGNFGLMWEGEID